MTGDPMASIGEVAQNVDSPVTRPQVRRAGAGIRAKLVVAMLTVSIVAVLGMGIATRVGFDKGFVNYLNEQGITQLESLVPRLTSEYEEHGSWDFLMTGPAVWFDIVGIPGGMPDVPPIGTPIPAEANVDITGTSLRIALFDAERRFIIGSIEDTSDAVERPIVVDGDTVGWLTYKPATEVITRADERFRQQQDVRTIVIGLVAVVAAASLAILFANAFLSPLRRIGRGIGKLAGGDYSVELVQNSTDEIAQLAADVNHLALVLDRNESVRRNLMADLSHELRTPIAILRAELEAMSDGVRTLSRDALRSLQAEVRTLEVLVNDIHELSSSDAGALSYRMHTVDLKDIVDCSVHAFDQRRKRRDVSLEYEGFMNDVSIMGDEGRINQLLNNLLENSLRYTDAGGVMRVSCHKGTSNAKIIVEDSEPGVPDELLNQLFDRFFRARPRRKGKGRGSGLGLAICRNIIEAHRGSVDASPSKLGGLRVVVTLPLADA